MPVKALYFSRFMPHHEHGGGSRRLLQIHEILKTVFPGLQLISCSRGDRIPRLVRDEIVETSNRKFLFAPTGGLPQVLRKWSLDKQRMAYRLEKFSKIWAASLRDTPQLDLAIMEDPIYFLPLFKEIRRLRIPIIAVCQNLEALSSAGSNIKRSLKLFREEMGILSQCRLVIVVSREEEVILKNLGIRSLYIPFYPVEPMRGSLLALRDSRKHNTREGILMFGSVKNLPTRKGLEKAALYWRQNRLEKTIGKLIIGGRKSEIYFDPRPYGDSVDFRGDLTDRERDDLLSRIKGFLCYQESGAGVLTRICEMLIAGIPVLANSHAARSYYNIKGVIEFRELTGLSEALKQIDALDGDIPIPLAPDIAHLSREIEKIFH